VRWGGGGGVWGARGGGVAHEALWVQGKQKKNAFKVGVAGCENFTLACDKTRHINSAYPPIERIGFKFYIKLYIFIFLEKSITITTHIYIQMSQSFGNMGHLMGSMSKSYAANSDVEEISPCPSYKVPSACNSDRECAWDYKGEECKPSKGKCVIS